MPIPGEHKNFLPRILAYATAVGWTVMPQSHAQQPRHALNLPDRNKDERRALRNERRHGVFLSARPKGQMNWYA